MTPIAWRRLRVERTAELRPPAKAVLGVTLTPEPVHVHDRDGWLTLTCWMEQTIAYITSQGQQVAKRDAFACGVTLPAPAASAGPPRWCVKVEGSNFWLEPGPGQECGGRLELEWVLALGPEVDASLAGGSGAGDAAGGEFVTIWADRIQGRQLTRLVVPVTAMLPSPLLRVVGRQDRVDVTGCGVIGRSVLVRGTVTSTLQYEAPGGMVANHTMIQSFTQLIDTGVGGEAAEVNGRVLAGSPLQVEGDGSRVVGWHVVELEAVVLDQGPLRVLTAPPGGRPATGGTVGQVRRLSGSGRVAGMVELAIGLAPRAGHLLGVERRAVVSSCQVLPGRVIVTALIDSHFRYADAEGFERHARAQGQAGLVVAVPEAAPGMEVLPVISVGSGHERLLPGGERVVDEVVLEVAVQVLSTCLLPLVTRPAGSEATAGTALVRVAGPAQKARGTLPHRYLVELERPLRQWVRAEVEAHGVSARALDGQVLCEGVLAVNLYYVDHEGYEQYRGQAEPFRTLVQAPGCRAGMQARVTVVPDPEPLPSAESVEGVLTVRVVTELLVEAWEVLELEVVTASAE